MKVVGIIGGMGPEAGAHFFLSLIKLTQEQAKCKLKDQDHIEVVLHNNTRIPDRTQAILGLGPSPVPELIRSVKILEQAGAQLIIIPCITSHYFLSEIQNMISTPIINAVNESVKYIVKEYSKIVKIGLIATTGTVKAELFQKQFLFVNKKVVIPSFEEQQSVMEAIYGPDGIKSGNTSGTYVKTTLKTVADNLIRCGAECIIAGCTEIPLVLHTDDIAVPLLNPMDIIARLAIESCLISDDKKDI